MECQSLMSQLDNENEQLKSEVVMEYCKLLGQGLQGKDGEVAEGVGGFKVREAAVRRNMPAARRSGLIIELQRQRHQDPRGQVHPEDRGSEPGKQLAAQRDQSTQVRVPAEQPEATRPGNQD